MAPFDFIKGRAPSLLLLAAAALALYVPAAMQSEFVLWDDDMLVYENPLTQSLSVSSVAGAFTSYDPELYVPLTILSFQIEHALVGYVPLLYHLDNLALHILAACLVFLLLERLGLRRSVAFLCALIFTVHPINTEAVLWVSARKDLLAAVFSLGAILSFLEYRLRGKTLWYAATLLLFLLALLSKPVAIVLPLIFLLLTWNEAGTLRTSRWMPLLPFAALSVFFLAIGLYGKQRNIGAVTMFETVLLAAKSTIFSLWSFIWPSDLSAVYLQTGSVSMLSPEFFVPLLLLGTAGVILLFWKRNEVKNACIFGALWYLLFLLPSFSNFGREGGIYFSSDRYIYLSQIGLLFLGGSLAERFLVRRGLARTAIGILTLIVIVALAFSAYSRSAVWENSDALFASILSHNDQIAPIHFNKAVLAQKRGERDQAIAGYRRTLSLSPNHVRAHNSLGSLLMDAGDTDAAISEFRAAIAGRETFAQAHINLAAALGRKGLYDKGLREYKRAFELAPQLFTDLPEIRKALENF